MDHPAAKLTFGGHIAAPSGSGNRRPCNKSANAVMLAEIMAHGKPEIGSLVWQGGTP
jgi:hypothetical protein